MSNAESVDRSVRSNDVGTTTRVGRWRLNDGRVPKVCSYEADERITTTTYCKRFRVSLVWFFELKTFVPGLEG